MQPSVFLDDLSSTSMLGALSENLISLSGDTLIILGIFLIFCTYTLLKGKSKMLALMFSLYLSGCILFIFPYWDFLLGKIPLEESTLRALIFIIFLCAIWFFIKPVVFARYPESFFGKFFQIIVLSVFNTTLLFFFAYHSIPLSELYPLSSQISTILASPIFFFWVLVIPLIAIYFFDRDEFV